MYYVIGQPRKSSLSKTQYRGSYGEINLSAAIKHGREKCKKKREILVHKPEEEIHYEPYMVSLEREYCELSTKCDSKVELPWKEIALPRAELKIRREVEVPMSVNNNGISSVRSSNQVVSILPDETKSTGTMELPWDDLVISDVVDAQQTRETTFSSSCDSSLEIPWYDLAFEKPGQITPFHEPEKCPKDDIEIPWDEIMIPSNITVEPKMIKHKHPSGNVKRRRDNKPAYHICHSNCQCDNNI